MWGTTCCVLKWEGRKGGNWLAIRDDFSDWKKRRRGDFPCRYKWKIFCCLQYPLGTSETLSTAKAVLWSLSKHLREWRKNKRRRLSKGSHCSSPEFLFAFSKEL